MLDRLSKTFHTCQRTTWDGITYVNNNGKKVKIDKAGRPYPVGKDGFGLMKTSRPPETLLKRMEDNE